MIILYRFQHVEYSFKDLFLIPRNIHHIIAVTNVPGSNTIITGIIENNGLIPWLTDKSEIGIPFSKPKGHG